MAPRFEVDSVGTPKNLATGAGRGRYIHSPDLSTDMYAV